MIEILVYILMNTSKSGESGHVVRQVAMFKTQQQCDHAKSEILSNDNYSKPILKCVQANIFVPR